MATKVDQYDLGSDTTIVSLVDSPPLTSDGSFVELNPPPLSAEDSVQFKIKEMKSRDFLDITQENQIFGYDGCNTPPPQYSKFSEKLRQLSSSSPTAHRLQCSTFCGGKSCKYENPSRWSDDDHVAFKGLFSHWVTDNVLAMARPSTSLFTEYDLLENFKNAGITAVINLQTAGEHSHCGPGLEKSGFTYEPEQLMKSNIYFYNYAWPDYGAPTIDNILDVVKVIDFSCSDTGKVAIHCHAGLGRTGVAIACYLLYSLRLPAEEAITRVREKRPGSIQTRGQLELITRFSIHLRSFWKFYPLSSYSSFSLSEYVSRQARLLHGEQLKRYKHIPIVISCICTRLQILAEETGFQYHCQENSAIEIEKENTQEKSQEKEDWLVVSCTSISNQENELRQCASGDDHIVESILGTSACCHSDSTKHRITSLESEFNSQWKWEGLSQESDPTVLFSLLFTYISRLKEPVISLRETYQPDLLNILTKIQKTVLHTILDTVKVVLPSPLLITYLSAITQYLVSLLCPSSQVEDKESINYLLEYLVEHLSS